MSTAGRVCPQCGYALPAALAFCPECGTDLRSREPVVVASTGPALPNLVAPLTSSEPLQEERDSAALAAALSARLRTVYAPDDSVRGARYLLGRALLTAERPRKAHPALRECLNEPGNLPADADIMLTIALARLEVGGLDEALHEVFDALLADPAPLPELYPVLLKTVSLPVLRERSDWLVDIWKPAMLARHPDGRVAAAVHVVAGACLLLQWRVDDFRTEVRDSVELAGSEAADLWDAVFQAPGYGQAAREPVGPAGAQLAAAILLHAFRFDTEALRCVDDALAQVFEGGSYPEADAYELRAELRLAGGDTELAGADFLEAGKRFLWRGGPPGGSDRPITCLRQATRYAISAEAQWHLAQALVGRAWRPDFPYWDKALLEEAAEEWDKGLEHGAPSTDTAWAYWTRFEILERMVLAQPSRLAELTLEQLDTVERWLLLVGETDSDMSCVALAELAGAAWVCGMRVLGAHVLSKSLRILESRGSIGSWDELVLRQHVVSAYEFAPDELDAITARYAEAEGAEVEWLDGVRASHLARSGRFDEAIPLLEKAIAVRREAWLIDHYALALLRARRYDDALAQYAQLIELTEPDAPYASPMYADCRAYALCYTGRTGEAAELIRQVLGAPAPYVDRADVATLLVTCGVRAGDFAAAQDAADDLKEYTLSQGTLMDVENQVRIAAELLVREGGDEASVERAGALARHITATHTPAPLAEDPARADEDLRRSWERLAHPGVPEWPLLARQAVLWLEMLGLSDLPGTELDAEVVVQVRGALAGTLGGEVELAAPVITAALTRLRELEVVEPERVLVDLWANLVKDPVMLAQAAVALGARRRAFVTELGEETVERAETLLVERTVELLGSTEPGTADVAPIPIALSIGSELVPGSTDEWQQWRMFTEHIPRMRDAVRAETGVRIPGVRVQEVGEGRRFAVLLDEVACHEGQILPDEPDPTAVMIEAVAATVRESLPMFVGIDQVADLLSQWSERPECRERVEGYLGDIPKLARLTWILRGLAASGQSVDQPEAVLAALENAAPDATLPAVLKVILGGES